MNVRKKFCEKFGYIMYDMCNDGLPVYVKNENNTSYKLQSLTEKEINEFMIKSEETGIDHLYEAVKDYPVIIDPNLLY